MKHSLEDLLTIMASLRDPQAGCPWDQKQTFESIAPYTIEEAYEVADAIARGDMRELRDELGDLLFQVVFYAQLGKEQGMFEFTDIVSGICEKMLRRHPHVFASAEYENDEALHAAWENEKKRERQSKGADASVLDGVAQALPALARAQKLQKRAAHVGFDWPDSQAVFAKCREELDELQVASAPEHIAEEVGDVLFSVVNLARHLGIEPEEALRQGNRKFERRFRAVEVALVASGKKMDEASLQELDELWDKVKQDES